MKNYHEMIQWVVDQVEQGRLRYHEWSAIMTISEIFGIPYETVASDTNFEKEFREQAKKEQRKAQNRASNEQRRLANLARKQNESAI